MKLLANILAAAALMLLVASWSANAESSTPLPGQPRQKTAVNAGAPTRAAETRQEEAAQVENDADGARDLSSAPLWYKMLPAAQSEQERPETQLNYIPALKDGWEAVSGEVSKIDPTQLKEAAFAQMRQFRTAAASEDQPLKIPAFLQNILNDPEARKSFAQFALGALGMTAAGVALGDAALIRDLSLIVLYVAALSQFFRGGVQLAGKVAAEAREPDGAQKPAYSVRHLLAKLLGARLSDMNAGEQSERMEEQA